jgi:putative ABC transport system permease protein
MKPATPPRFAARLLDLALSADDAEAIGGDLDEMFSATIAPRIGARSARRWYWRQVIAIVVAHETRRSPVPGDPYSQDTLMTGFQQDLSYASRSLRKQPGFAVIATLMLALGIGATLAIFALANAVLFRPLPFAEPDRIALLHLVAPDREAAGTFRTVVWSWPKYRTFREHQQSFEAHAMFTGASWNVTGTGSPERVVGESIEAAYFAVLGIKPQIGRTFTTNETNAPGAPPLLVLGHGMWVRRFGSDPAVIGRPLGLNGRAFTIVGVLPPGFRGLTGQADVFVPLLSEDGGDLDQAWSHSYFTVARLKPGVSFASAKAEVTALGARIDEQYRDPLAGAAWSATASPLNDERVDAILRRSILMLLAAVGAVLLIVCSNLTNLMLARGLTQQREIAIRLALGASRGRILRQLMTESALLASIGATLGLGVAYATISAGAALMPDLRLVLPRGSTGGLMRVSLGMIGFDVRVLLFTVGVAASAALLFGLGPAWAASRRGLSNTMKAGASGSVSQGTRGLSLRNLLIVGEIALALVLLTAGGLMLKSVARLQATELGFDPVSLLTFRMALPAPKYDTKSGTQFFDELLRRLAMHGEVTAASYGNCSPVSGGCNRTLATFPDLPPVAKGSEPSVGVYWASPAYFGTLGIRLLRGRTFTEHDRVGQPKVVVVNESAARALWKGEDPIGRRIGVGQGGFHDGAEVIGVVADVRYGAMETSVGPDVYLPLLQSGRTTGLLFIRSHAAAASIVPAIRREVAALDAELPITEIKMMEDRFSDATWRQRMSAWLLGVFASLALLLAAMGIYGVIAQGVEQRTREIGVRLALGARRADILRLVIRRVVAIAIAGITIGLLVAVPSMRLLTTLLYQVKPSDPIVLSALAMMLLGVAVVAGYLPARRATRVDPLVTLKAE